MSFNLISRKCLTVLAAGLAAQLGPIQAFAAEEIPTDETGAIAKIADLIQQSVSQSFKTGDGLARRDAHAKAHGCVRGRFEVLGGIPNELKAGVLATPSNYPAWIRYSNGSGSSQKDSDGDGRGMAIKLMGLEGGKTQDFLMINHPVFFVRNVADYVDFQVALSKGSITSFFFPSANPLSWRLHELGIANAIRGKKVANPLDSPYWSLTPYQLGGNEVKFSVRPCHASIGLGATDSPNFLRENMQTHLAQAEACFDFLVQPRTNPQTMPIEDPTIEWSETESPYIRVARLHIPRQSFTAPAQQEFCEDLSFTPWHALPEHRPLGGINRARKEVYRVVSRLRHELNGKTPAEPRPFRLRAAD